MSPDSFLVAPSFHAVATVARFSLHGRLLTGSKNQSDPSSHGEETKMPALSLPNPECKRCPVLTSCCFLSWPLKAVWEAWQDLPSQRRTEHDCFADFFAQDAREKHRRRLYKQP